MLEGVGPGSRQRSQCAPCCTSYKADSRELVRQTLEDRLAAGLLQGSRDLPGFRLASLESPYVECYLASESQLSSLGSLGPAVPKLLPEGAPSLQPLGTGQSRVARAQFFQNASGKASFNLFFCCRALSPGAGG